MPNQKNKNKIQIIQTKLKLWLSVQTLAQRQTIHYQKEIIHTFIMLMPHP